MSKYIIDSELPLKKFIGVDYFAEIAYLVMKMWSTASAGIAAFADQITLMNHVTGTHQYFLKMRVTGFETKIMHDHDPIAT